MKSSELYAKALSASEAGKTIRIPMYSVTDAVEKNVRIVLQAYLDMYNCSELKGSLYTIIKELIINAVKADFKNVYFENYQPKNVNNAVVEYETALKLFNLEMRRERGIHLEKLARARDIHADILFSCVNGLLYVEITNPVGMTEIEFANVQRKLASARKCADITEYFMEEEDDTHKEGAGLGLILINMILRSLGLGELHFSLRSTLERTTASLVIPLTAETMGFFFSSTDKGLAV